MKNPNSREYPPINPGNIEYNKIGYIRAKYDYPNAEGIKYYGAGSIFIDPVTNNGLMVYARRGSNGVVNQTRLGTALESVRTTSDLLSQYRSNGCEVEARIPVGLDPDCGGVAVHVRGIGKERWVRVSGNIPFGMVRISAREEQALIEEGSEFNINLKTGDGLFVASPGILKTFKPDRIEGVLRVGGIDPAKNLMHDAKGYGLENTLGESIIALRVDEMPGTLRYFMRRKIPRLLHLPNF